MTSAMLGFFLCFCAVLVLRDIFLHLIHLLFMLAFSQNELQTASKTAK